MPRVGFRFHMHILTLPCQFAARNLTASPSAGGHSFVAGSVCFGLLFGGRTAGSHSRGAPATTGRAPNTRADRIAYGGAGLNETTQTYARPLVSFSWTAVYCERRVSILPPGHGRTAFANGTLVGEYTYNDRYTCTLNRIRGCADVYNLLMLASWDYDEWQKKSRSFIRRSTSQRPCL